MKHHKLFAEKLQEFIGRASWFYMGSVRDKPWCCTLLPHIRGLPGAMATGHTNRHVLQEDTPRGGSTRLGRSQEERLHTFSSRGQNNNITSLVHVELSTNI